ncbi:MAG: IS200/IS605 family transposase [Thermoprotei archaeon]
MSYQQLLWYSFFWNTKRRKRVLLGEVKEKMIKLIDEVAKEKGFVLGKRIVYPNAVYVELGLSPKIAPHNALNRIKSRSSKVLRSDYPELRKLPSLWTRDYHVYNYRLEDSSLRALVNWINSKKHGLVDGD